MKKSFFGIKHIPSGDLLRLEDEQLYCGATLTLDASHPIFEVESAEALASALFEDTPTYNSQKATPSWGGFRRDQMEPVHVEIEQTVTPVVLRQPTFVKVRHTRDIPLGVARRYAGTTLELVTPEKRLAVWLIELAEGQTRADLEAQVGTTVACDRYNKRHLYSVGDVPEEFVSELRGKPGVWAVVSERRL